MDDRALFRQFLDHVEMGEDAGVVHRAGLRQHGDDIELPAEDVELIGFLQVEFGGHVVAEEDLVGFQGFDDPLRARVFLSFDPIMPTELPQPTGGRRCRPCPRRPWPGTRSWA